MLYLALCSIFYSQKNIDDILKQRGKNANLSINYLESMLLYHPDNIRLKLMLLENYNRADRVDKAFKLIRDIERSTLDREILSQGI